MLELKGLTKFFGEVKAVDKVSFRVEEGEVFGLLGENGAGKTTTLRMLATMLKPSSGTAVMGSFDVIQNPEKVRGSIGILFGGETGLYDRLTVAENIAYFGELNDMPRGEIDSRIRHLTRVFGMDEYIDRKAGKLSKGMKQKAAFARAIVHNPEIMLFDEPTSGLDVGATRDVHSFIHTCRAERKTIVFSSHSMNEVEKLCDRIGIIHKGALVDIGTLEDLKRRHGEDRLEELFIRLTGDR
jgi:sodium transport system ATP-binding protein